MKIENRAHSRPRDFFKVSFPQKITSGNVQCCQKRLTRASFGGGVFGNAFYFQKQIFLDTV